jgi:hypothetical protein
MNICKIEGCSGQVYGYGYCRSHYNKWKRGTLSPRKLADLPGERWADIEGHPGLMVSTMGRVKSTRGEHERLMKARPVEGRMLVGDHFLGNITVHLAVLRAFAPAGASDGGKAVFMDNNSHNTALTNLRWETSTTRIEQAIAMAERSSSPWAAAFVAFWRGDQTALDRFFEEMRRLLLSAYRKKASTWRHYYPLEAGEYAAATLYAMCRSIKRGSMQSLDNLTGWALTAGDNTLRQHHRYAAKLTGFESSDDEQTSTIADVIGWTTPSPETMLLAKEAIYRNTAANRTGAAKV